MIRPITCVCMVLAGGAGLYMYQVKHRAQLLDREINRVVAEIDATHDRTKLLRTDWALLNEPERLQELTERFLPLHPMQPSQWAQLGELAARLPAVAVAAPAARPDEDEDAADPLPSTTRIAAAPARLPVAPRVAAPVPAATQIAALPAPPHPAAPRPLPHPPAAQLAAAAPVLPLPVLPPAMLPPPVPTQLAERREPTPPRRDTVVQTAAAYAPRPVPLAAPRPVAAGVLNAAAAPAPFYAAPTRPSVQTVGAYASASYPLPAYGQVGSALGMAHGLLAPPVPVAPVLR